MNRAGYAICLYLLTPLIFLYLLIRGIKSPDYRHRWSERFGLTKLRQTDLHIHSVSMGETLAAIPLIKGIQKAHPHIRITITTSSPTGSHEVQKAFKNDLATGLIQHCYLPFDFTFSIKRFLKQVSPRLILIMETELWPNLIHYANKQGAKVMLVNGRLSEKSANQYHKWQKVSIPMLKQLDTLIAQTPIEAKRFQQLSVDNDKIQVCGNLKFDLNIPDSIKQQGHDLRVKWQTLTVPTWLAGSVHPGEFDAIISAHQQLLTIMPNALLIMVPRHPEQFAAAANKLTARGMTFISKSSNQLPSLDTQVILGDTMGELLALYGAADQAFIGGTLIESGGHNPLEPAAMGLPVFSGPNHWDFQEITELLKNAGNLNVIDNANELSHAIIEKFQQHELWQQAHNAGLQVMTNNRGALQKQLTIILDKIN